MSIVFLAAVATACCVLMFTLGLITLVLWGQGDGDYKKTRMLFAIAAVIGLPVLYWITLANYYREELPSKYFAIEKVGNIQVSVIESNPFNITDNFRLIVDDETCILEQKRMAKQSCGILYTKEPSYNLIQCKDVDEKKWYLDGQGGNWYWGAAKGKW